MPKEVYISPSIHFFPDNILLSIRSRGNYGGKVRECFAIMESACEREQQCISERAIFFIQVMYSVFPSVSLQRGREPLSVVRTHREGESNEKCGVIIEGIVGQINAPQGRRYNPGFFVLETKNCSKVSIKIHTWSPVHIFWIQIHSDPLNQNWNQFSSIPPT